MGDYVSVAHGAILHGCHVEDGALIGMGAIVLDGAHIGKQAVIGAGSLVLANTTIPAGSLVFGQPAHVVRELSEAELDKYGKIADRYVENAKRWHSQK